MQLRCGGVFSNNFITNFPQNAQVKKFKKSVNFGKDTEKSLWFTFLGHPVQPQRT